MTTYIDNDPLSPICAMVFESEAEMLEHLDIYHDPNTRFHLRTWSGEYMLTPLALAVEIATYCTLCACEECWHKPE